MSPMFLLVTTFFVASLVGCGSSPEERQAEANAGIAEEKAKMMRQYNECLKRYEGEMGVSEKCAPYKEATETFISK